MSRQDQGLGKWGDGMRELDDRSLDALRRGVIGWLQSGNVPTLGPWQKARAMFILKSRSPEIDMHRPVVLSAQVAAMTSRALLFEHEPQLQPTWLCVEGFVQHGSAAHTLWSPSCRRKGFRMGGAGLVLQGGPLRALGCLRIHTLP